MSRALALTALLVGGCSAPTGHAIDLAPPASAPATTAAPARGKAVRVTAVTGTVELQRTGAPPRRLQSGDELAADDVVRTVDGRAELDVAGSAEVQVAPGTQVSVAELTSTLQRVRLRDGRISAVVHAAEGDEVEVEASGPGAVARTRRGSFSMLAQGSHVAVAASAGEVTLAAHGRSVQIGAGQISVVEEAHPPSAPQAIPASLYIKLAGAGGIQRTRETVVHGATTPGAVISVSGVRTVAGETGEFETKVPLREGANDLVVESEDALGRKAKARLERIVVDTHKPGVKSKVEW